ncbi:translocation protein Sec62-domain-containing protein [Melanogaster broomeanus]|nr:translocation protein Sec62-domain-containing protein [Melanogaster broomeanus]
MSTAEAQQVRAPPTARNVVQFLRSSKSGMKIRVGALNGKRVDYFKGKSATKALLSPAYAKLKNVPAVTTEAEAEKVLASIIPYAFYLRIDRGNATGSSTSPRHVTVTPQQAFAAEAYYAWFYEGSQWTTYAGGLLMVAIMLAGVMFPLWPPIMRLGVWYISVAMLGVIAAFFGLAIVRLIFYIITVVVASPGIWIFPNLFADVGVIESFIPVWEWDLPKKKGGKKKKGKAVAGTTPEEKLATNGGAFIEEVVDESTESSRPGSQSARVEEVLDEDS